MLTEIDYKLRSFFLKLDRRDYISSNILAIFYRFLNPIKFFRQLFLGVKKNKEIFLHENGYMQYQFESENLTKIISRSNKIINDHQFKKKLDSSKKKFLQSYKIDFFDKENHIVLFHKTLIVLWL